MPTYRPVQRHPISKLRADIDRLTRGHADGRWINLRDKMNFVFAYLNDQSLMGALDSKFKETD